MSDFPRPLLVVIGMAMLTTVGDYCLKRASQQAALANQWMAGGFLIYGVTALGWAWTMRYLKLATIGVVYSVSMILFMAMLGAFAFNESLTWREVLGIALAIVSISLLARFAE